jgi:hypothetical protein
VRWDTPASADLFDGDIVEALLTGQAYGVGGARFGWTVRG